MRRLVVVLAALAVLAAPARAQVSSSNVEVLATIPEVATAIATNFIGDTMFVSTTTGLFSYDVSDPTAPRRLGALPMYIWENEDMDVDSARKRVFISRDPRGFTSPAAPGSAFPYGAVHIIDASDPANLTQVGFFTLPAGHTSTCVNACDFLWTAGPGANPATQGDWTGRPVFATDVSDPANPVPCPDPIDLGRNDGVTDYAHDVQVDSQGVAWVSGAGGVRGYWTSGAHRNPLTGATEVATGCKPVPYAGSGTPETGTPSRFMHNAWREPGLGPSPARTGSNQAAAAGAQAHASAKRKRRQTYASCMRKARRIKSARKRRAARRKCAKLKRKPVKAPVIPTKPLPVTPARTLGERVLYGTEENITTDCATSGRFVAYDLEGTFDGEGFKDTAATKHRMKVLDTWTPEGAEGASGCDSAHYFSSRGDGIFANAFYGQGVRFLDVSNPAVIRQVGWYRPTGANTWAAYWHKGLVYFTDNQLGVHILRFKGGTRSRTVTAPPLRAATGLRFDRRFLGGLCPLPV